MYLKIYYNWTAFGTPPKTNISEKKHGWKIACSFCNGSLLSEMHILFVFSPVGGR